MNLVLLVPLLYIVECLRMGVTVNNQGTVGTIGCGDLSGEEFIIQNEDRTPGGDFPGGFLVTSTSTGENGIALAASGSAEWKLKRPAGNTGQFMLRVGTNDLRVCENTCGQLGYCGQGSWTLSFGPLPSSCTAPTTQPTERARWFLYKAGNGNFVVKSAWNQVDSNDGQNECFLKSNANPTDAARLFCGKTLNQILTDSFSSAGYFRWRIYTANEEDNACFTATNSSCGSGCAYDDPHVTNLKGEKFEIYATGYVPLLTVKNETDTKLHITALIERLDSDPTMCYGLGLYFTEIAASGSLLRNQNLTIKRNHSTAGNFIMNFQNREVSIDDPKVIRNSILVTGVVFISFTSEINSDTSELAKVVSIHLNEDVTIKIEALTKGLAQRETTGFLNFYLSGIAKYADMASGILAKDNVEEISHSHENDECVARKAQNSLLKKRNNSFSNPTERHWGSHGIILN